MLARRGADPPLTGHERSLNRIIARVLARLRPSDQPTEAASSFVDLAPTDEADQTGIYSKALLFATRNPKVLNIALTGPYGSGKSSIIKAFLKRHRPNMLQISLAAFLPEATADGSRVTKQEIERSILQQMLYGASADQLPFSRFKRIKSPGHWSLALSLYAILGVVACWHLFRKRDDVISGKFLVPFSLENWPNLLWFALGASFLLLVVQQVHKASFGVSLKSISLKDIEITPAAISQESILNRHLDEIIYFFQSTSYDLVVIEDLDRFNNTEIFVTLREINALVNANVGVRRTVRFLYALRDDMFVNTDRTKFFEFIVPVIPIINSSNAIDKVLEQGRRLSLDSRLDRQFLREVSRYLNDLRLIQNIFNEYAIYVANLEADGDNALDANKLLAILIYKNVFPRDFEELHRGRGNLARILGSHAEFISTGESGYRATIKRIENEIEAAERQVPADLLQLRRIYAMAILEKLPAYAVNIVTPSHAYIEPGSLAKDNSFDQIIELRTLNFRNVNGYQQTIDLSGLQAEVDSVRTYVQRKEEVERRAADFKSTASKSLLALRTKSAALRFAKFNEVARLNEEGLADLFDAFNDDADLARFLVLEGYLDDSYYQYTSLFHSGRLSPNDNKFLIQIRGFTNPGPDFQVDNPKEVIAAMRDDDFRQRYVLNVKLVDCLLGNEPGYPLQVAHLFKFLASNFESCGAFFTSYYAAGAEVPKLVAGLVASWPHFVPTVLADTAHLLHVSQIVANLPGSELRALASAHPELRAFLSVNLARVLALGIDVDLSKLEALGVEARDLVSLENFPAITRFLFEQGRYALTVENLEFIFRALLGEADLDSLRNKNLTTVNRIDNATLSSRIGRDFPVYLKDVLLRLEGNTQESAATIVLVLSREDVDPDELSTFLSRQTAAIPVLNDVPARFQSLALKQGIIEPTWANCLAYMQSDDFDAEVLTSFLETPSALAALPRELIPGEEGAAVLRKFLVEDDAFRDATYRTYVKALPRAFNKFPDDLAPAKLQILIEEAKVMFTTENVETLEGQTDLQILFVAKNIDTYLEGQADYPLDDDFRELLLEEDIGDSRKLAIVRALDLGSLSGRARRAGLVGAVLNRAGADVGALEADAARAIILNSHPISVQISLLNKCEGVLSDLDVREILAALPAPYSEIKTGYRAPIIDKAGVNLDLVRWLDRRNIISSWRETVFGDAIRVNLYRRDAKS